MTTAPTTTPSTSKSHTSVRTELPAAKEDTSPHRRNVAGKDQPVAMLDSTPTWAALLADPMLALWADVLDDAEATRIANENRLRQLTRSESDSDGEERGFGLSPDAPAVQRLTKIIESFYAIEKQATHELEKLLRDHPLGPWVKAQRGVGDKQAARLLAVIGDPYIYPETGEPRTVSQLRAYCGHGDPARHRHKGMTQTEALALGNPVAKMRLWNIATSCIKQTGATDAILATSPKGSPRQPSPYREVYDKRRAATADRLHDRPCARCGPAGHPAQPGTPWSPGHQHADGLRVVGKEILKDLWRESRRLHGVPDDE